MRVFIDEQIELQAYGTGDHGEFNDIYVRAMVETMDKHYDKLQVKPKNKSIVSVDDKRKWFLNEIIKLKTHHMGVFRVFEQHGDSGIIQRQDAITLGFQNKSIIMSPKNKKLVNDL